MKGVDGLCWVSLRSKQPHRSAWNFTLANLQLSAIKKATHK